MFSCVATGTISVTTNLSTAKFTITGPSTYTGSGTSATFPNAPVGSYTITFGLVAGYMAPVPQTQPLSAGSTISFNGVYTRQITLTSISGWTAGSFVEDAEWQGQPKGVPANKNIYDHYYAIDACQTSASCGGTIPLL
jgi:hypothetical protein